LSPAGRRLALILFLSGLVASSAVAQVTGRGPAVVGGFEAREYRFAAPFVIRSIAQSTIPIGGVATYGRLSLDAGTFWAATTLTRRDGTYRRVTGFTDTQVRAAWVFGRDAIVVSLMANLPTGLDRMSPADFDVLGTVSSTFLAFPVNAYANGGSLTAAAAGVLPAGAWTLGLATSLRGSRTFTPVVDPVAGPLRYRAGIEGRARLGADRLLGASRLSLGLTLSGFGDDQYAGLGISRGSYQPGTRWIGEAVLTAPLGAGTLTGVLWGYHRRAGDTAGVRLTNAERVAGLTLSGRWPVAPRVDLEPGVEVRHGALEGGKGLLGGAGMGGRVRMSRRLSAWGGVRHDRGYLDVKSFRDDGSVEVARTGLRTWYLSGLVRVAY